LKAQSQAGAEELQVEYTDSYVRPMHEDDVLELATHLRQQDIDEIRGLGEDPAKACIISHGHSKKAFTMRSKETNDLICCFGIGDSATVDVGMIWCLGTDLVENVSVTFLRNCKTWITHLLMGYDYAYNLVSKSNTVSRRWLQWIGAEFSSTVSIDGYEHFIIKRGGSV